VLPGRERFTDLSKRDFWIALYAPLFHYSVVEGWPTRTKLLGGKTIGLFVGSISVLQDRAVAKPRSLVGFKLTYHAHGVLLNPIVLAVPESYKGDAISRPINEE
jgi:hypothetical protein